MNDRSHQLFLEKLFSRVENQKRIFPIAVIGTFVLLGYTFLPVLSDSYIQLVKNWFVVTSYVNNKTALNTLDLFKYGITTFTVVGFIYMLLHYIFLAGIERLNNSANLAGNHNVYHYKNIDFRKEQAVIAILLSFVFFMGVLWINYKNSNFSALEKTSVLASIFFVLGTGILAMLTFSFIAVSYTHLTLPTILRV